MKGTRLFRIGACLAKICENHRDHGSTILLISSKLETSLPSGLLKVSHSELQFVEIFQTSRRDIFVLLL